MRRAAQSSPARPRTRRKTAAATDAAPPVEAPGPIRNVGSVEAILSLGIGILMVVAALVPRSFRQLFLLVFGGALAYRGLTGHCGLYQNVGIDTGREALLPQVGRKLKAAAQD